MTSPGMPAFGEYEAVRLERDTLRSELAGMKKKLVAAESAIEAAATLRARVARLEAQLKKG